MGIALKDFLGTCTDAEAAQEAIAVLLERAASAAAADCSVELDGGECAVVMTAGTHLEAETAYPGENGGYGISREYLPTLDCEGAFDLKVDGASLAAAGISATVLDCGDIEWGTGRDADGNGLAECTACLTVTVDAPDRLAKWLASAAAGRNAA